MSIGWQATNAAHTAPPDMPHNGPPPVHCPFLASVLKRGFCPPSKFRAMIDNETISGVAYSSSSVCGRTFPASELTHNVYGRKNIAAWTFAAMEKAKERLEAHSVKALASMRQDSRIAHCLSSKEKTRTFRLGFPTSIIKRKRPPCNDNPAPCPGLQRDMISPSSNGFRRFQKYREALVHTHEDGVLSKADSGENVPGR
ncbi:uncharacterized protein MYCFIDRAFT_175859 [Pseudocercospora fijiensis CIRAD86]|uniref:Uncharacterized protein n=1 Tax=Pseudocercospora fijiensis (strain CIRAD86) TaxID=383855 RepID=M3AYQ4_PSEFD|nr:uncharacterized protein MYCFIDRAFT_175859 [Pseudocercospora fijiensis CIRAD86]EME82317.1 hypothetical protein MYCFIDRAFT_175859 [Pseudocercospora fijiensis CIRAD86]